MEDIMLIRSSFMRRIISQIINKALKKQTPGVEVELKEAQVNWVDKEQNHYQKSGIKCMERRKSVADD